jgi:pimeloyl-ACP methyl ester carboxylesterase
MRIQTNNFSIAYTDAGQGLPLLLVHGYPLCRRLWEPQIAGLADVARLIAPDLRGHGDSEVTPGPYSMELFADDLKALLDALGVSTPVALCGLSMGGYVAFAFYRKYAARVAGLVLTATRAAPDNPAARAARDQAIEQARQQGTAPIIEAMLPRLLAPENMLARPELLAQVRAILQRSSLQGVMGDLQALKERPDSTPTLAQIGAPTLLLAGAHDAIIPLQEMQAMQAAIPGSRLEIIPNAGHLPNLENPDAFNAALRRFLEAL